MPISEVIYPYWYKKIHEEDIKNVQDRMTQALDNTSQHHWKTAYRITNLDGEMIYIFERANILRDGNGKAYKLVGVALDICKNNRLLEKSRI